MFNLKSLLDPSVLALLFFGTVACGSGIAAVAVDGVRKVFTGILVLAAGLAPVAVITILFKTMTLPNFLMFSGMLGSAPLFLMSFYAYGLGKRSSTPHVSATACLIGCFAAAGFSLSLVHLLGQMP